MSLRKHYKRLGKMPHQQMQTLVVLCAGTALLLAIAVGFSSYSPAPLYVTAGSQVAATVHGTASNLNPAPAVCTTDGTASGLCLNSTSRSAILSAHLPGTVITLPADCGKKPFWERWRDDCRRTPTVTATGRTVTEQCRGGGTGCTAGITAGNAITVPQGARVTLELDWLMQQRVGWPNGCKLFCGDKHDWGTFGMLSSCSSDFGLSTSNYDGYHSQGSITLTPTQSTTYTVTCTGLSNSRNVEGDDSEDEEGGGGSAAPASNTFTLSIPITVTDAVAKPTLTIVGNGQNPANVEAGQSVTILATYTVAPGDTLLSTAINDSQNNSVPGVNQNPQTQKTYTFTPNAPGTYTFYPAARTLGYPNWDNHGASLTVTVGGGGACSGPNETGAPPNCTCTPGFERNAGGVCTQMLCGPNATGTPPNCQCEVGYVPGAAGCERAANLCGPNETGWPQCVCVSGYIREESMCIRQPLVSIWANGQESTRVRTGRAATITWAASGIDAATCMVRSQSGAVLATGAENPTPAPAPTINAQTIYTLSCLNDAGNTVSDSATVNIIPTFEEI